MNYLSVTQVIPKPKGLAQVHPDVLDAACERGKKAHSALHTYLYSLKENKPLFIPVAPEIEPYFQSGKHWIDLYIKKIIFIEQEFIHPLYKYVGHPDLVAILKGDKLPCVADFKTPIQYQEKEWSAQLSAYKNAIKASEKIEIGNLFSVRLKANGKRPLVNQVTEEKLAFQGFLNALGAHRYFRG